MKLNQLNIQQAKEGLAKKQFSSVELVKTCLDEIKLKDKDIHAFLALNDNALKQAAEADSDQSDKPLKGIPFALKDNFLSQGIRTTASAKVLDQYLPQYNATVYQRLLDAGAILLGKTNLDAWAHGSSTETSDYGPTHNPHNLNHLPGGSSGGSAAAVAADMCTFAIGSETAGSIRQPAAWCGVVGFKPTYGRVSRYGVVAMCSSTDSPGPLTKTVYDSALVTQIIGGKDPNDATSSDRPVDIDPKKLNLKSLAGWKIALPQEYLDKAMNPATVQLIKASVEKFKQLGAKVKTVSLLDPKYSIGVYTIIQRSEVYSNLCRFDGIRYGNPRSFFSHEAKNRMILGVFGLSSKYHQDEEYYNQAQSVRALILQDFDKLFQEFDLYIGPTSPGPALKVGASKNNPMFGEMEDRLLEASSIAGLTGISLPCGLVDGLPIGLQITGPQFAEQKVLQAAALYEK